MRNNCHVWSIPYAIMVHDTAQIIYNITNIIITHNFKLKKFNDSCGRGSRGSCQGEAEAALLVRSLVEPAVTHGGVGIGSFSFTSVIFWGIRCWRCCSRMFSLGSLQGRSICIGQWWDVAEKGLGVFSATLPSSQPSHDITGVPGWSSFRQYPLKNKISIRALRLGWWLSLFMVVGARLGVTTENWVTKVQMRNCAMFRWEKPIKCCSVSYNWWGRSCNLGKAVPSAGK